MRKFKKWSSPKEKDEWFKPALNINTALSPFSPQFVLFSPFQPAAKKYNS
jgi:hypothetical protein